MISSTCCRFALRAVAGVFLILACHNPLNARMTDSVPPDVGYRALPRAETTRRFAWEDVNSWKVLGMQGDREIVDAGRPALRFALQVVIDPFRLRKAIESYGIPESWMHYSYRTEDEKLRKEKEQTLRCAARGIARGRTANTLEPDYYWVVDNSREDVREAAVRLRDVGRRAGYDDFPRFVELLASFVQSLEYRLPPDIRRGQDGTPIQTFGLTMPLETLYNGHGDCDTKSVLFASLLANFADTRLILVRGANHLFAGVRAQPRPSERYVRVRGENFVLIELTHPWRVGHIPKENWHAVQLKQMEIIPLFR